MANVERSKGQTKPLQDRQEYRRPEWIILVGISIYDAISAPDLVSLDKLV